jgi:hypothetical protein
MTYIHQLDQEAEEHKVGPYLCSSASAHPAKEHKHPICYPRLNHSIFSLFLVLLCPGSPLPTPDHARASSPPATTTSSTPDRLRPAHPQPCRARPGRCRPARPPGSWSLPLPLCSSARAPSGAAPPVRSDPDLSCLCWARPPGPCTGCPSIGRLDPSSSFY